jgi:hypothetical protein
MDARQQKGLEIAATFNIVKKGDDAWTVPSQTLIGKYSVTRDDDGFHCSCPDYDLRRTTCKHGYAVEFYLKRETVTSPDGETTVTETRAVRVTYAQDWPKYNAAQQAERELFGHLLHDLCAPVPSPEHGNGRRPIPVSDAIFSACYKVYSGVSARRFSSDLREAQAKGFIDRPYHFNTVLGVIENPDVTPTLHELIAASAAPLKSLETAFAIDSTGFGTQCFYRHYDAKYGHDQNSRTFLKLHALIGTCTNVIAAAKVTDRHTNDYKALPELVETGAQTFDMKEISADKAYSGRSNVEAIVRIGAEPYIPFRSNVSSGSMGETLPPVQIQNRRVHELLPQAQQR